MDAKTYATIAAATVVKGDLLTLICYSSIFVTLCAAF